MLFPHGSLFAIYIYIYPNLTGGLIFKNLKFLRLKELLVFFKDMGQIVKIRKPKIKKNVGKLKIPRFGCEGI